MIPSFPAALQAFRSSRRRRMLVCFAATIAICGVTVAGAPSVALAQVDDTGTIDAVTRLNKRALEEYDNLNFDKAQKTLTEALELCGQKGLDNHPVKARTLIHLGVVILAEGDAQRPEAIKQFQKALAIQSDIKLTTRVANPEVQSAFDEASKSVPATAPATPTAAADVEPAPATEGVAHDAITSAAKGSVIPVSVTTDPSLEAKKVVLAYRPDGAAGFVSLELKEYSAGNWSGSIPDTATDGDRLVYTVTVQNAAGEVVGSHGTEAAPLSIRLKGVGAAAALPEGERDEPEPTPPPENPTWLLGLAVGSGVGYASGYGDVNNQDKVQSGFGLSTLGHVLPEVGYFVSPDMLLSFQLRIQAVSGATPLRDLSGTMCGADHVCDPAKGALAALAKISWLFGEAPFLPYFSLSVGAGQIRHLASFPKPNNVNCGAKGGASCVDTVAAGPILLGPGVGFILNATPNFGFTLGVNTLLGFPTFTFHVDVNAGVVVQL